MVSSATIFYEFPWGVTTVFQVSNGFEHGIVRSYQKLINFCWENFFRAEELNEWFDNGDWLILVGYKRANS